MTAGRGVHRYDFDGRYAYILADRRGLCRQHRHDPRPDRSGPAGRGRALVDPRPMDRRRRGISLGRWVSPRCHHPIRAGDRLLCQLLAPRPVHPRHRRHGSAEADLAAEHQPGLSAPDPHLPADAAAAEGAQDHGGGRRGRGEAAALTARLHLDLRHHRGAAAAADRDLPGARAGPRRRRRSRR